MYDRWRLGEDITPIQVPPSVGTNGSRSLLSVVFEAAVLAALESAIERHANASGEGKPLPQPLDESPSQPPTKEDPGAARRAYLEELKQRRDPWPIGLFVFFGVLTAMIVFLALVLKPGASVPERQQSPAVSLPPAVPSVNAAEDDQRNLERQIAMSFIRAKLVAAVAPAFKNDAPDRAPQGGRR